MKATEILRRYRAGERDFQNVDLRGQNFKGQNLAGANFSGADIRSTNFTNSNLTGAVFTGAKSGLRRRRAVCLAAISLLITGISSITVTTPAGVVSLMFEPELENQMAGWSTLIAIAIILILLIRKGLRAFYVSSAAIPIIVGSVTAAATLSAGVAAVGALTGVIAIVGSVGLSIAVALMGAVSRRVAIVGSIAAAIWIAFSLLIYAVVVAIEEQIPVAVITVISMMASVVAVTLVSAYVGWRSLQGDERDAFTLSIATAFAAIGGTSFRGAILTDVDFSMACLKNSDLRRAVLLRTSWQAVKKLEHVRLGGTYLHDPSIRELLLTRNGRSKSYVDMPNLIGLNLQGADLTKADFTGSNLQESVLQGAILTNASLVRTNFNHANLQDTDLSNVQLVQAQLDQADLTGAILTGAYIEDWNITTRTQLNGIRCDYVFMRLPQNGSPDPNPRRKPDDWSKNFTEGEFVDFIAPMIETLDLYHNQTIDPRAVAISFNELREQNPDAELEIVSMERRGKNRDKLLLRAETTSQTNLSELSSQYFERYNHLLTLPSEALQALVIEKDKQVKMLARMVDTAIDRPQQMFVSQYKNKGDVTVSEQGSNASKYDMRGAQFSGGFAETVKGDQVGGTQHNYAASEKQSLADAALEIQRLLKQLEETNPTATAAEQKAFVTAAIPATLRERAVGALQSGGRAAVEELLDNPYVNVVIAVIEGWQGAK